MFHIDNLSRKPVYEQIVDQTETLILTQTLKPGSPMPSVRSLAVNLSINPNTIQKAYIELDRKGLIQSVPGKGSFITEKAIEILHSDKRKKLDSFDALIREMALAGISEEELIAHIHEQMKKGDVIQ